MDASTSPLADLRRLGLSPGASPDALKTAWRRAVSQLHPDRHGSEADRDLAEVNAAFQRLQEFQRRHGRLPGAIDLTVASPAPAPRRARRWPLALAGLAAAALVLWPHAEPADSPAPQSVDVNPPAAAPSSSAVDAAPIGLRPERIEIGLDADEVERLAGPPMFRSRERWEYGPSEVRFTDGKVSGWYSSPLRPLPVPAIDRYSDAPVE